MRGETLKRACGRARRHGGPHRRHGGDHARVRAGGRMRHRAAGSRGRPRRPLAGAPARRHCEAQTLKGYLIDHGVYCTRQYHGKSCDELLTHAGHQLNTSMTMRPSG